MIWILVHLNTVHLDIDVLTFTCTGRLVSSHFLALISFQSWHEEKDKHLFHNV
uniref:Uncharacterized protein n=1 Tax=Arundo donax TaxID=35708 RepID=A0A0A8ZBY1_ARUDO